MLFVRNRVFIKHHQIISVHEDRCLIISFFKGDRDLASGTRQGWLQSKEDKAARPSRCGDLRLPG